MQNLNSNILNLCHKARQVFFKKSYQKLAKKISLQTIQQEVLKKQLAVSRSLPWGSQHLKTIHQYSDFRMALPITTYENWHSEVKKEWRGVQNICKSISRYVATSGSTGYVKWIPYSPLFNQELQNAASAWLGDLSQQYPQTLRGHHYWSLSWLTNEQRQQGYTTNDGSIFSPALKHIHEATMAIPEQVSTLETCLDSQIATATYLAGTRDLTLISVWSPSFALELFRVLANNKDSIAQTLLTGRWSYPLRIQKNLYTAQLLKSWDGQLTPEFFEQLWPNLKLVSSWNTGSSQLWAQKLQTLLPQAHFQGKGLWATEGVVTIPFRGNHVLAAQSHFYEFRDLRSNDILPSWKLEQGQEVQPILSTGNGFYRYQLPDKLICNGYQDSLPILTFQGRLGGTDLVGEKLERNQVSKLLNQLRQQGTPAVSLIGHKKPKAGYQLLTPPLPANKVKHISSHIEQQLQKNHHYRLARDLNQLEPVRVKACQFPLEEYYSHFASKPRGQVKIEDLALSDN